MIQLSINYILMGFITYSMFEAQITHMYLLKTFKMSEILLVIICYTICNLSFLIVYTIPCIYLGPYCYVHELCVAYEILNFGFYYKLFLCK
jgi:hypothetical protein